MKATQTVGANVEALIGFNRSMALALENAEDGSKVEDAYFIEKLKKTANRLGYDLIERDSKQKEGSVKDGDTR